MDEEGRLIEQARRGSVDAFSRLLRLHQAPLRSYLAGFIRDLESVDDVAQEAFLGAFRNLEKYKGDSSFRTWLFAIAKNHALAYLRDEVRRHSHRARSVRLAVSTWLAESAERDGVDPSAVERELRALEGCIEKLPKTSAAIVTQYYLNRRTAGQIAIEMGRTQTSVWKTLSRVRQALRQCVELGLA